jgi:hypothetical protein
VKEIEEKAESNYLASMDKGVIVNQNLIIDYQNELESM